MYSKAYYQELIDGYHDLLAAMERQLEIVQDIHEKAIRLGDWQNTVSKMEAEAVRVQQGINQIKNLISLAEVDNAFAVETN